MVVDGEKKRKRGVRILVSVGSGGVFTSEYGTISHVICENRGKKTRSQSHHPPDHLIDLSAVGFSRPNRIQDTGYTTRRAAHVAYMDLYFYALLPLDFPLVCVPYSSPSYVRACMCVCVCDTTESSTAPLPSRAKVRAVTSVGGE